MSGISAIVAVPPGEGDAVAPESKILTASTVQFEPPSEVEAQPHPTASTPAAAPVAGETVREESVAPARDLPKPETILKLDWQTDLTQIETNPAKHRERAEADEEPPAPRPKRVRPQATSIDEGPLLQIETQRAAPAAGHDTGSGVPGTTPASHPL